VLLGTSVILWLILGNRVVALMPRAVARPPPASTH
jgi:hypothetical protein